MHVDDITVALATRDIASIKEAFLALANYPKEDRIDGLTGGDAMIFLEAAAEALRSKFSTMPQHSCATLRLAAQEAGPKGRALRNVVPGELARAGSEKRVGAITGEGESLPLLFVPASAWRRVMKRQIRFR